MVGPWRYAGSHTHARSKEEPGRRELLAGVARARGRHCPQLHRRLVRRPTVLGPAV